MNDKEIREALTGKVETAWENYRDSLLRCDKAALVEHAAEIAGMELCRRELTAGNYPTEYAQYLLRFEDPLEVVYDQWDSERPEDVTDAFSHALWRIYDTMDAEQIYPIDPEYEYGGPEFAKGPVSLVEMGPFHYGTNLEG